MIATVAASALSAHAAADVVEFTDANAWQDAVGQVTTIDFTGLPDTTPITDQYSDSGITVDEPAFIFGPTLAAQNDKWGLHGPAGLRLYFDSPQNWVAIDHPGVAQFELYSEGELVHTSSLFFHGGLGNFSGLVSDTSFDEVYIFKPDPPYNNNVFIDDLHWGTVPAPGALSLLFIASVLRTRHRRM